MSFESLGHKLWTLLVQNQTGTVTAEVPAWHHVKDKQMYEKAAALMLGMDDQQNRRVFVLTGWRKDGQERPIASDTDHMRIHLLCKALNDLAGRRDLAEGVWDREEIKGSFTVQELYGDAARDLDRGVEFMNYEDVRGG